MWGISWTEVRQTARGLANAPTVAIFAILCLSLGIGATTAISSAISRALLRPLPFTEPDRLVAVHRITPQSGPDGGWSQSVPNYLELRDRSTRIAGLSAVTWGSALIELPGEAIQASQHRVTGNLFQTLGARAQHGRMLLPDDDRLDAPAVAVMSDELWRTRFAADRAVVGQTFTVGGTPTTIVGITPQEFRVPLGGNMLQADLWVPIRFTPDQLAARRNNNLLTLGRLTPGASVETAQAELRQIFAQVIEENPVLRGDNVRVAPLHAESLQSVKRPLLLIFGAVCLVLLIAATNVAALLFARGVQRRREMAVRTALGASTWDVLRPTLLESLLISLVSCVIGIALAAAGIRTIGLLATARMPQLDGMGLDPLVLGFALLLSIVTAVACGALPALRSARANPQDALRSGGRGGTGADQHRTMRGLVAVEIGLSLVLLIGAGLVMKAFGTLLTSDPGFDPSRIVTLRVTTSPARYPDGTTAQRFLEPALAAMRSVPGVEGAGTISAMPYRTWGNNSGIRYEGRPNDDPSQLPIVEQRQVTPGFFAVTRQRLASGRLLEDGDDELSPLGRVAVVNQALVARDFEGQDPVGQRYHLNDTTFATIVGVVSDIKNAGPVSPPRPEMYTTVRQTSRGSSAFDVMVRVATDDPMRVVPALRSAIRELDPTAAVGSVAAMEEVIARSLGRPRFYFTLLGTFAGIAIVLAASGLYGLLSYAVAQRTREIGIRSALGGTPGRIVGLVAKEGIHLVGLGVILGVTASVLVTRLMVSMLYGVSPLDGSTWVGATTVMVAAAVLAAIIPARRAARVDPLVAMRAE
jgi:putative ABC transport system permease protein